MKTSILAIAITALAFTGAAHAARQSKDEVMSKYQRTGEVQNCVPLQAIDSTDVLDDKTILFKMKGKDTYVNELPYQCPQLKSQDAFSYKTSVSQLCNTDIITVIDTAVPQRLASCGLGKFEKLSDKAEKSE
jgi:hypothetical protein